MRTTDEPLDAHEARLLSFLRAVWGNQTKAKIRNAWESGNYSALLIDRPDDVATLQQLRNCRGPGWLAGLKWTSIDAVSAE